MQPVIIIRIIEVKLGKVCCNVYYRDSRRVWSFKPESCACDIRASEVINCDIFTSHSITAVITTMCPYIISLHWVLKFKIVT
jgi:hypothetical protein